MTAWTTDPAQRNETCTANGRCDLTQGPNCTICGAEGYVTADTEIIKETAKQVFAAKFTASRPLPPNIVEHKQNKWGDNIAHLIKEPTTTARDTEASHPSIAALLTPPNPQTQAHYANIMNIPTLEAFFRYVKKQTGHSAPGPSKFRYSLLTNGPDSLVEAMHLFTCMCLTLEALPTNLKHALLYPIPKSAGPLVLTNMRPIALLEIGLKLVTGWLAYTIQQTARTAVQALVHASQYGSKAESSPHDPLLLLIAAIEDANDSNNMQDIWLAAADVQGAYDSVGPDSKALSYRAAGFPEGFINLAYNLDQNAFTSVLVPGVGTAPPFQSHKGFRQGDPLSVIGWLLFINPLIKWLDEGLPPAAPQITYTPTDKKRCDANGAHTRNGNPPCPSSY